MSFKKVEPKQSFPKMEEEILKFWEENKIFEKSVEKNSEDKSFIFYEGPPTANGVPGLHHVLARSFKDIIPRYKTMKGYRVERKAGWDTHGLPVEIQVEKSLGLKSKQEIENIVPGSPRESIIEFNKKCKESVWKYKDAWEKMTRRMGYWVDMKNPYITYENKYIESIWWVIAQIWKSKNKKGESLVYKGHKVVPYCYRCGTALSSHEVAQGYQKIKDNSITVEFKTIKEPKTSILVWTTTPWTLPGNVALAVGPEIEYAYIEKKNRDEGELVKFILAKNRLESVFGNEEYKIIKTVSGKELVGLAYEPLYPLTDAEGVYKIIVGDFVSTEDGTGIVHIAPAFGEDDSNVGRENNLPTLLTVDQEGKISADVPGKGIPVKKKNEKNKYAVDELIMEDLKKRSLFFKDELYEHDYPFCWRCDTPLIYYAKPSWFIRMSELAGDLVKNNENINWIPEYIKEGRFGEWLRGVKDWAISRERYWGTPLPIWECANCQELKVVDSMDEIKKNSSQKITKIIFVRHGESEKNVQHILSDSLDGWPLTEKGRSMAKEMGEGIVEQVDVIITSPILRAKETAEILNQKFNVKILEDVLIKEIAYGQWNNKSVEEREKINPETYKKYNEIKKDPAKRFIHRLGGDGESRQDVMDRTIKFIKRITDEQKGKTVLVVGHGVTYATLIKYFNNLDEKEYFQRNMEDPKHESVTSFYLTEEGKSVDLHKPFIDDIKFSCSCGGEMKRAPEVLDVWFDSGSMPLAQFFYPNGATVEDKKKIESGKFFPADYISEAIDQTRGWFYTLHAIATLLHRDKKVPAGNAFKNVICLAHILDKDGKKMSKSRGNVVEPMEVMDKFGADMLRWMLFTINQPGMPKRFDIKGMQDIMNRVFRMLWNSYSFFVMYANIDKFKPTTHNLQPTNLLDRWIISELNILIKKVDDGLNSYDIYGPAKEIEKFIDNLSNWYIRRSRKRFWKPARNASRSEAGGSEDKVDIDKESAYQTLHYVLVNLAKLMAPFTPFIAEEIYRNLQLTIHNLQPENLSVHLAEFPEADEKMVDEKLNQEMQDARAIITEALQLRAKAGIKVRQPIASLKIKSQKSKVENELIEIIKEEVNAKEVIFDDSLLENVVIDTNITEDLKLEGQAREVIRFIQEMRKEAGYEVDNRIRVCYNGSSNVFEKFGEMIKKEVLANGFNKGKMEEADLAKEFKLEDKKVTIYIKKD